MSTTQQPAVTVVITAAAGVEVKKFMEQEGVTAADGGLRVGVQPGGCSGFRYQLLIEEKSAEDDVIIDQDGYKVFVDPFSRPVPERRHDRLRHVDAGLRLHLQEPELHRRLRLRQLLHGVTLGSPRAREARDRHHGRGPLRITEAR